MKKGLVFLLLMILCYAVALADLHVTDCKETAFVLLQASYHFHEGRSRKVARGLMEGIKTEHHNFVFDFAFSDFGSRFSPEAHYVSYQNVCNQYKGNIETIEGVLNHLMKRQRV